MVTYKILLDTRRAKSDGTYSVTIRITHNRKSSTHNTGVFVQDHYWTIDKAVIHTSHPNANLLNKRITEEYLKVQKAVIELEAQDAFDFDTLKDQLKGQVKVPPTILSTTFKSFSDQLVEGMFAINKTGNAIVYSTTINRFMAYMANPKLKFKDIDYNCLEGFKQRLIKEGMKQNTISNYFRTLRAIYNKAIKAKVVDRLHYPFLDISIKTEKTAKRALSVGDIVKIYNSKYKVNTAKWHARNYFFLSFCLRGASFTDVAYLTSANIQKQRVTYNRRKTHSQLTIQLLPLTSKILESYKGRSEKYLVPVLPKDVTEGGLDAKKTIAQWIKTTNKWLKRIAADNSIDAEVTTYVTRHSWATVAKRLGYSNELIAECLGHSYGNKITNIYLDSFDQHVVDEVNVKVLLCLEPCGKQVVQPYHYVLKQTRLFRHPIQRLQLRIAA